ncbi:MAG: hypothetical protein ABI190_05365 [Casimicrobiaceae bacterium]
MTNESRYFADLYQAYAAEIEDNLTDSEGKVVLQQRLNGLRGQFGGYLPVMEDNPEMVSVVFYDAFTFDSAEIVQTTIGTDPDHASFPTWAGLEDTLTIAPWAMPLIDMALAEDTGDRFMVIAGCLEYIRSMDVKHASSADADTETVERPEGDGDDDDSVDLAEAGDDWLSRQGFDSQR